MAVIVNADVHSSARVKRLDRFLVAFTSNEMPVIEYIGEFLGELCVTQVLDAI